jgi:ATP-dependent DNA ligase
MIEQGTCRFFSRKNHALAGYRELGAAVSIPRPLPDSISIVRRALEVKAKTSILDGELVVTDPEGRTVFADCTW